LWNSAHWKKFCGSCVRSRAMTTEEPLFGWAVASQEDVESV